MKESRENKNVGVRRKKCIHPRSQDLLHPRRKKLVVPTDICHLHARRDNGHNEILVPVDKAGVDQIISYYPLPRCASYRNI